MTDLEPYLAVSKLPPIRNDMSIAVDPDTKIEDLCDIMKNVLGNDASVIEEVAVLSETPYDKLPVQAIERIGMLQGQKNMLIRVIFRSHERTLTQEEVNRMRDQIYKAVHQGNKYMLTTKCA
jgi:phenylalanyl-tRNA synthetase alpha chain